MNPGDPPPALPRVVGVQRSEVGAELARRVPDRGEEPVLVAVDGVDAAGKTVFADQLGGGTGRPVVRTGGAATPPRASGTTASTSRR